VPEKDYLKMLDQLRAAGLAVVRRVDDDDSRTCSNRRRGWMTSRTHNSTAADYRDPEGAGDCPSASATSPLYHEQELAGRNRRSDRRR
jgi:hypothetical protein